LPLHLAAGCVRTHNILAILGGIPAGIAGLGVNVNVTGGAPSHTLFAEKATVKFWITLTVTAEVAVAPLLSVIVRV